MLHHLDEVSVVGSCKNNLYVELCFTIFVTLESFEELVVRTVALGHQPLNMAFKNPLILLEDFSISRGKSTLITTIIAQIKLGYYLL